jgi:hypothetical protein
MVPDSRPPFAVEARDLGWLGRVTKRPTQYIWRANERVSGLDLLHSKTRSTCPFLSPSSETDFDVVRDHRFDLVNETVGGACEGESTGTQYALSSGCFSRQCD